MKKHQVIRFIKKELKDRSDLKLLATIGDSSYLLWSKEGAKAPRYRLIRLEREEQELRVQSGLSYFNCAQDILLAPAFVSWQDVDMGELPARSKQHLRRSLKRVLTEFEPATHGRYELLRTRTYNEFLQNLHAYFLARRFELSQQDQTAIENLKKLANAEHYTQLMRLASLGEVEKEDDELESLLDSFTTEGDFSGSASFSLNQEKALQKLTDFQLGERYLFPLFLAAGLSLQGAKQIDIRLDSDEIWVEYSGLHVTRETLLDISHSLLSASLEPSHRGLRALGQALLQSAGHKPSALQLESGEASFDLRGFPELDLPEMETTGKGVFYTKLPLNLEVAKRFFHRLQGSQPELELLRSALRYLPTPWTLNDKEEYADFGISTETLVFVWSSERVVAPSIQNKDCLLYRELESSIPAQVVMLVDFRLEPGLVTVVDGLRAECPIKIDVEVPVFVWLTDMQTDLSGQKLVHTQLLDEVLEAVKILEQSLPGMVAKEFRELSPDRRVTWQTPLLRLTSRGKFWLGPLWALECLPLVGTEEWTSLNKWSSATTFLFTEESFERGLRSGAQVARIRPGSREPLARLFGECQDMTRRLGECRDYYEHLDQWLENPVEELELGEESQPRVSLERFEGALGFCAQERARVRLMSQFRSLPIDVSHWLPPYVELVVNHSELEMDNRWKNIQTVDVLESIRGEVEKALHRLIGILGQEDFGEKRARVQMTEALRFCRRRGYTLKQWSDIKFIQKKGFQGEEYFSLKDYPHYLD